MKATWNRHNVEVDVFNIHSRSAEICYRDEHDEWNFAEVSLEELSDIK